jgi:large subunit ribosomal protein L18
MRGSRADARHRRHRRVRKTIKGTAARPRLAVYRSNRYIYVQVIDDETGHTVAAASSRELKKGGLSVKAASKVGKRIANRAKDVGIDTVVFDRGGYAFHGKVKALADAARKEGLTF